METNEMNRRAIEQMKKSRLERQQRQDEALRQSNQQWNERQTREREMMRRAWIATHPEK